MFYPGVDFIYQLHSLIITCQPRLHNLHETRIVTHGYIYYMAVLITWLPHIYGRITGLPYVYVCICICIYIYIYICICMCMYVYIYMLYIVVLFNVNSVLSHYASSKIYNDMNTWFWLSCSILSDRWNYY